RRSQARGDGAAREESHPYLSLPTQSELALRAHAMARGGATIREAHAALIASAVIIVLMDAIPAAAQEIGTATGHGTIISVSATSDRQEQRVSFAPRYAFAYFEGQGAKRFTWVVLTEKEPPLKAWAGSRDRAAARQTWCEKEKAAFVAVQIDAKQQVYAY